MTSSTQWRINFSANNGGTGTDFAELQFRTQVGAPLEFPGTGGVSASAATSSMTQVMNDSEMDGWFVYPATSAWWAYDYGGTSMAIKSYVIRAGSSTTTIIKDWTLEYWDGAAWQVADTRTNVSGWSAYECREFTVGVPGYVTRQGMFHEASDKWRMVITANNGDPQIMLHSLALRRKVGNTGSAVGWNSPTAISVTVTSDSTGSSKDNIFASSTSNYWATVSGVTSATITAQFQWSASIRQYTWVYASTASTPRDFTLEYYDYTDSTWKVADARTGQTGGVAYTITNNLTSMTNDGDVTLPTLDLFGSDTYPPDIQLERLTLSGTATLSPPIIGAVNLGNPNNLLPAFDATPHTLAASAVLSAAYAGDLDLPGRDTDASLEGPLPLPLLSLVATGFAGNPGNGLLTLPLASLAGGFEDPRPLPLLTLAATGATGEVGDADLTLEGRLLAGALDSALPLPLLAVAAVGFAGGVADGLAALPGRDAAALVQPEGDYLLPLLDLSGTGLAGGVGQGSGTLAKASLAATAYQDTTSSADATLPAMALAGVIVADGLAHGALTLGQWSVQAVAQSGQVLAAAITVPLVTLDAHGYQDGTATVDITLPLWSLDASTAPAMPLPTSYQTLDINTHTKAVATHTAMAFNSFAQWQGMVLAASPAGIVALTGDTDNGVPIDALLRSGVTDMASEKLKRVLGGYVGYRADGALDLTLITDQHHEYVYRLEPRQDADALHASRVKTGRGVDGRYWQWQLANRDGEAFALDSLALDATPLSRRA